MTGGIRWMFYLTAALLMDGTESASSAYEALDELRGRSPFNPAELKTLMKDAQPGVAYPTLSSIPQTSFTCSDVQQAGFYPDPETQCQVYHRCEPDTPKTSYLCPNGTLFSPVILVCDYWYNVQCSRSKQFENFSNPKIYGGKNVRFLEDGSTTNTPASVTSANSGAPSLTASSSQTNPSISITLMQSPSSRARGRQKSQQVQRGNTTKTQVTSTRTPANESL